MSGLCGRWSRQRGWVWIVLCLSVAAGFASGANAASAIEPLTFATPERASRYQGLIAELRCPKCQNVNLAGSDAPIAHDLRVAVRRLLAEGRSDQEIRDFLRARYGDFVLYDPPLQPSTYALWFTPLLLFLGVLVVVWRLFRRRSETVALGADESRALAELLDETR